jgi:hypothetical protein
VSLPLLFMSGKRNCLDASKRKPGAICQQIFIVCLGVNVLILKVPYIIHSLILTHIFIFCSLQYTFFIHIRSVVCVRFSVLFVKVLTSMTCSKNFIKIIHICLTLLGNMRF